MEAIGDFIPGQADRPGIGIRPDVFRPTSVPVPVPLRLGADLFGAVDVALAVLRASTGAAVTEAARFGVAEASDFAGRVEELSRVVDHLQIVAAAEVDRTRGQAAAAARNAAKFGSDAPAGWVTGRNPAATATATATTDATATAAVAAAAVGPGAGCNGPGGADRAQGWVDDGYRNTTEFLRARLRITAAEARRRLALASDVLPRTGLSGQPLPAGRGELAAVLAAGDIASRAATLVSLSLDRVRHAAADRKSVV